MTGIYQIRNIKNEKRYYGKSVDIEGKRWHEHRRYLKRGSHHCAHLQNAWKKYGEESFVWEIVEECQSGLLLEREQHWLDTVRLRDENGILGQIDHRLSYNTGAISNSAMSGRSHEVLPATREKISTSLSGEKHFAAKLTWEKVREIREKYAVGARSQEALAREYSVARATIELIIHNVNWKDHDYCPMVENQIGGRSDEVKKKISAAQSGEKGYWAKLTWSQIREIREKYPTGKYRYLDLAKEYGVTKNYIGQIVRNISWKE